MNIKNSLNGNNTGKLDKQHLKFDRFNVKISPKEDTRWEKHFVNKQSYKTIFIFMYLNASLKLSCFYWSHVPFDVVKSSTLNSFLWWNNQQIKVHWWKKEEEPQQRQQSRKVVDVLEVIRRTREKIHTAATQQPQTVYVSVSRTLFRTWSQRVKYTPGKFLQVFTLVGSHHSYLDVLCEK